MTGPPIGSAADPKSAATAQATSATLTEFDLIFRTEILPRLTAASMISDRMAAGIDDGLAVDAAFFGVSALLHRAEMFAAAFS